MYNVASTLKFSEVSLVVEPDELHDHSASSVLMAGVGIGLAVVSTMFLFGFSTTGLLELIEYLPIKAVMAYALLSLSGMAMLIMHFGLKNQLSKVIAYGALSSFISGAVFHAALLQ